MPSSALSPPVPSLARPRWELAALFLLIALSIFTASLGSLAGVKLRGDRLLGLVAVAGAGVVALRSGVHWTAIHTALGVFTGMQVLASLAAAYRWPAGLKFASVYVLGFGCFVLAAEWARGRGDPWRGADLWIRIGAGLGLAGAALAFIANWWQIRLWGAGAAQWLRATPEGYRVLYAAKVTFDEWNLYSTFLLVAFALALWRWRPGDAEDPGHARPRGGDALALWRWRPGDAEDPGHARPRGGDALALWRWRPGDAEDPGHARPRGGDALALWRWRPGAKGPGGQRSGFLAVAAIALGLVFGLTRAAWLGAAVLAALWLWARRPGWRPAAALGAVFIVGFAAQTLAVGEATLYLRVVGPVKKGEDRNIEVRRRINEATIDSWRSGGTVGEEAREARDESRRSGRTSRSAAPAAVTQDEERPPAVPIPTRADETAATRWARWMLGKGAGSINTLDIELPGDQRMPKPWNGNVALFLLHDSGLLGLASFAGLIGVVAWRGRRALRGAPPGAGRELIVALLGAGVTLLFAYQFTHGMWLMYPYVYLGLLTAAIDTPPARPHALA